MALLKQPTLVKPLPGEIRSKIRSGIAITSISDCVEELVYNSIDAGSKTLMVRINLDHFNVTVDDDGSGLTEADLEAVGGRYCTSKCKSMADLAKLQYYGYRGEALASIIEVSSTVDIITRPKETLGVELLKKYENGQVAGFIEKRNTAIRKSGTTVTVGKLLSKLPVRQKRVDKSIQLEEVKRSLEKISLTNPSLNIELRNDKSGVRIFKFTSSTSYTEAFNQLYESTIGYEVNFIDEHFLYQKLFFSLSISSKHYRKKYYQFVFLNGRYMRRCRVQKWLSDSIFERVSNSPKNDKFPVYILNITCPLGEYDVSLEPKKQSVEFANWESVQSGIEGLISKLKSKHNIGIVESSTTIQIDKNRNSVTSYDVKGALHSRFAARPHEQVHEIKSNNSNRGSIGRSSPSASDGKETRAPRSLTRSWNNSHVVDIRALRKARKTDKPSVPENNNLMPMEHPPVKKPRLTAGVFEKFPVWKAEFQKEKAPLPMLRSKSSPNLNKLQGAKPNVVDIEAMDIEKSNYLPYDEWKMQRFIRDCHNPLSNENPSNLEEEAIQLAQALSNASSVTANDDFKTPNSTGNLSLLPITDVENVIHSRSQQYLENLFKNNWKIAETDSKSDIVRVILQFYSRTVAPQSKNMKPGSSLFKSIVASVVKHEKTLPQFKKPRPKSTSTNHVSPRNPSELQTAKHSDVTIGNVLPPRCTAQDQGGPTSITKCPPPLLNVFPIQKSHTADWTDKMMLSDYCERDLDLFPTDWSVEIVNDTDHQEWLKTEDVNGREMFVNLNSGESSYDMVHAFGSSRKVSAEEIKKSNPKRFMWLKKYFPRGFRQFCNANPREITKDGDPSKLSNSILGKSVLQHIEKTSDSEHLSKWKDLNELRMDSKYFNNANLSSTQTFTSLTSSEVRCWKKLDGVTNSFRFSKDDLDNVIVICPFDRKFILANLKHSPSQKVLIVAFDQHAVHERIRLEKFVEESFMNARAAKKCLVSMELMPPYKFTISDTEVRVMQAFKDFFEQSGLKFQLISSTCIKINSVPKCFGERAATEPLASREKLFRSLIFSLIQEQIHHIRDTKKGIFTTIPKTVFEVLCSQACHGAIKFGDELDIDTCKQLILDLKKCKTPFQCAHGRPSVVPLAYVDNVTKTFCSVHASTSAPDVGCSKCTTHDECSSYFCKPTSDISSGYFSFLDTTSRTSKELHVKDHDLYDPFGFNVQDDITKPSDFENLFMPVNVTQNDKDDEESPYFF
ncbi:unnamed protein product [Orchesella dallaii]|uniref:DNA mismatch repair protein Mlh3 n=1 Tax=Orchesella dallaii TaxID=48710 RepID=A0ABP1RCR9_9HEXA